MGFFDKEVKFFNWSLEDSYGCHTHTIHHFISSYRDADIIIDHHSKVAHKVSDGIILASVKPANDSDKENSFEIIEMECDRLNREIKSRKVNKLLAENYESLHRQFGVALESIAILTEEVKRLEKEKQDKRKEQNGKPNNEGSYFKPRKRNRKNRRKDHNRAV